MGKLYTEETKKEDDTEQLETGKVQKQPLGKAEILLLNLSWYGLSVMFLILSVEVVPAQIQSLVGEASKGRWLGGMVATGAIITFVAGPLVGMRSDRMVSKFGKRRPVMLAATLLLCLGLFGMAFSAPSISMKRPNNQHGNCSIDLVLHRCMPYWNGSSPSHTYPQKGGLPHEGVILNPSDDGRVNPHQPAAGSLALYFVFYMLVTTSFAAVTVPYNALIADKSHHDQRGLNSGVMGFMILFGNITGAGIGLFFLEMGVFSVYSCVVGLLLTCVVITLYTTSEEPGKDVHDPIDCKAIFFAFWEPLKEQDFRWVFITRFLMQQGISTVTGFLEFWLSDMVQLPNCWSPERSVAMMLLPLLGVAAIGSVICGVASDRLGKRKPLVIMSALMMCGVTTALAFTRGDYGYYVAISLTFVFGTGFGSFQAVDFALVMDVLPAERDKAKDIAVWNQAMTLPQALATPIGGLVLDIFESINCELGLGYIILFLITSVYFLLSGVFVTKIKGVQ